MNWFAGTKRKEWNEIQIGSQIAIKVILSWSRSTAEVLKLFKLWTDSILSMYMNRLNSWSKFDVQELKLKLN